MVLIHLGREYSYYRPDSALDFFDQSLALSKKLSFEEGEFYSQIYSGEVLATRGNYSQAQKLEMEAFHKAEDLHNDDLLSDAFLFLGNLFFYQGNNQHALEYYSRTTQVDKNDTDFEESIAGLRGRAFLEADKLDSAYSNAKRAFDIENRRKELTWILPAVTLAAILSKEGKEDSALAIYRRYRNALPKSKTTLEMTIPMARIMLAKNQVDSAIYYLKKTFIASNSKGYLQEAIESSGLLSNIYKKQSNLDSAYAYMSVYNLLQDKLNGLNKNREVQNEEFDNKLYEEQIRATEEKYNDNLKTYGFILFIVIFLVLTFLLWRNNQHRKREFALLQKQKEDEKTKLQNEFQQILLRTQLEIQEQTLKNLSQEIHDNIGQILSLAKLNLGTIDTSKPAMIREKVDDSKNLVSKAIQDLRDLAKGLNADHFKVRGLAASIEHELEIIKKTGSYETIFESLGDTYKLEPQKELILFRIVQEVFNNIIRHARAGLIVVKLNYERERFSMLIHDDGRGFDVNNLDSPADKSPGLGIKNMWDRAEIIGAQLAVSSAIGYGTTIKIQLPVKQLTDE
ncbi:MAG TPA: ATP-binding protein [Puia sp.]|nr:ATP-binding protein [Puia sp.]